MNDYTEGATYRVRAPEGNVFVTVNEDGSCFIRVGKAGTAVNTLAEAIGRLVHLHLRTVGKRQKALFEIADTLEHMSHDRRDDKRYEASSIPDAVAQVLRATAENT